MQRIFVALVAFSLLLFANSGCRSGQTEQTSAYHSKINAFTSGVISNQSVIRVLFSEPVANAQVGQVASQSILDISPSIKGQLYWEDLQTLVLKPTNTLPSGQVYTASINMDEVFPDEDEVFSFGFEVMKQDFLVEKINLRALDLTNLKENVYVGKISFADFIDEESAEQVVKVKQNGKSIKLRWEHSDNEHIFYADGVIRSESSGSVIVEWDGKSIDVDKIGSETYEIPALGDFKVMEVNVIQAPTQTIQVYFSDPLLPTQNLSGLIDFEGVGEVRFTIDLNVVSIHPLTRIDGEAKLKIFQGIKNCLGYPLKTESVYHLLFETPKPQIEFIGQGTILPDSKGLILPFKAVSVRAVEVQVVKIFESNICMFLQSNRLDGHSDLRRAGRLVVKKIIMLDGNKNLDLAQWNNFSLDLATLISPDPGAIYQISLKLKPNYVLYPCNGQVNTNTTIEDKGITDEDIAYWDTPDASSYSSWDGYEEDYDYDWQERDNPCHPMYYRNKVVSRNVLGSNLGMVAKGGTGNELLVAVTDIVTTEPLPNVEIEVYDFQNQIVGRKKTGPDGIAHVTCSHKPYLVVGKHLRNKGYLRVDDGTALSLSRFDISGQTIKKGIKGFIYGERGVWRPGDTLFVTAIIEDKLKTLPQGHPLVFELADAQGRLVVRQTSILNDNGIYLFKVPTSEGAPTGLWNAKVVVGGVSFEKSLKVETIKPNRLKIEMDFGTNLIKNGSNVSGVLKCRWLHGAIADNLDAKVTATLSPSTTHFKGYDDFVFDDPARKFSSQEVTVFDGQLNANGQASISPSLNVADGAPGFLKASFMTRVFEEGGDFSVDRFSVDFSPFNSYVGISTPKGDKRGMLLTDTLHSIQVVTLDANGKGVTRQNLKYYIYKINWRWWWESGEDDLARYTGYVSENMIASGSLSTLNGKGKFTFRVNYPDWGRYLIRVTDDAGGHATGKTVYVDWPGWAMKPVGDNPQEAAMLSFSADKEKYNIGEKAKLTFPSPSKGRALVSIETGSRVITAFWVETQKGLTEAEFDITTEMTPNIYAHVTLIQPHNQSDNHLPIRMYGVIPLMVEDASTHLKPIIKMPNELQPEGQATITVSEASGNKMAYTLAIVDEGLLDLTRYQTPNPWQSFYAREALGVKTWDLYDYVMGAYGGKIEQAFSLGGDDDLNSKKGGQKANRFKPMVKVLGPFVLEKGKTQSHKIVLPRYVGSVRTMVVACHNGAYGFAEVATPVRKPVMVMTTLPRVLGPDEKVKLPINVFAMKDNLGKVTVRVKTSDNITIQGETTKQVDFKVQGDEVVTFDLNIGKTTGVAKVFVEASASGDKATEEIAIEIRNPNPPVTTVIDKTIEAGASAQISYQLPGIEGSNKAFLEVSSIPAIDFGRRLKYLLAYPHGCVEQTTSAAFPQLFMGDVIEINDEFKAKVDVNIRAAIARLKSMITTDGGFSYWPGNSSADDWGTSYAGHFFVEAEKKGYLLPGNWKRDWVNYQKKQARSWVNSSNGYNGYNMLGQAYRLYTLALAGQPDLSAMNRMRNEPKLTINAKWRLAAAYALAGQTKVAEQLVENIATTEAIPLNEYDPTYGSEERNSSLVIETMVLLGQKTKAAPMVIKLASTLSSQAYMSTQTTAYSLLAISRFASNQSGSKEMKFSWSTNNKKRVVISQSKPVFQDSIVVKGLNGTVSIVNEGKSVLFARVVMEGIPDVGEEKAMASNLSLSIEYTNLNGEEIDVNTLTQGTDFMAIVKVGNTGNMGNYKNLALSQIFPSGWEIRNTRLEDGGSAYEKDLPSYRDYRDDRVYSYFDLNANQHKRFVVLLNATYKGRFYLPGQGCSSMYNNSVSAYIPGMWVDVE